MLSVMDGRLLAWARALASRENKRRQGRGLPPRSPRLWLFTDAARLPDPLPAIAGLPRGLGGVVLRHDGVAGRAALARSVARLCRARRLALVVAGDARLAAAIGAGVHLREGRWPGPARPRLRAGQIVTSSAHGRPGLRRAERSGAALAFLSPAFATASHPGARGLGPARWAALARGAGLPVGALGGVAGRRVGQLSAACRAAGAIAGLAP
jgi:thiamine-phosphate pyrophosphorylase